MGLAVNFHINRHSHFMTFRTGFIQKNLFKAFKLSVTKDPDAEGDYYVICVIWR